MDTDSPPPGPFAPVSEEESGQKLLQFLQRRLDLPPSLLHRWLRTGQIRLNGRRARPFDRITCGDEVRLPPFAGALAGKAARPPEEAAAEPLRILAQEDGVLALVKPAGLAVHGGSGIADTVLSRLERQLPPQSFGPVPAHRLDRSTSGVLLCALSYEALIRLQGAFRAHAAVKEYLAWVEGRFDEERLLVSRLARRGSRTHEKVRPAAGGKKAVCMVRPLSSHSDASLVHLRLFTGRTHQIRAQMAEAGHPLFGDARYGAQKRSQGLFLHAWRLTLPDGASYCAPPPWTGGFSPASLPSSFEIDAPTREKVCAALAGR